MGQINVKRGREWEGRNWKQSSLVSFLLRVAEKWSCSLGERGKDMESPGLDLDGLYYRNDPISVWGMMLEEREGTIFGVMSLKRDGIQWIGEAGGSTWTVHP